MPQEICFENIPAGYSLSTSNGNEAGTVDVLVCEFTSSEDGDHFIKRLEGFPAEIVSKLSNPIKPSQIDHLLAVIRSDKTATVYVNELKQFAKVMVTRAVNVGELVYDDDIGDIDSLHFEGVEIPGNASILFLFSIGWRKALFYDFSPTQVQEPRSREYDINRSLGQFYSYLKFQNFFKISELEWERLLAIGWFPFITLKKETLCELLNYNKNMWNVDDLLPRVREELVSRLSEKISTWQEKKYFESNIKFIQAAAARYLEHDYISSISILYPRIEGMMRAFHLDTYPGAKVSQVGLVDSIIPSELCVERPHSLLLPYRFKQYLLEVYFANFDPKGAVPLSRNSISHGVADESQFSMKGATLGFLALDQLFYYLK